MWRDHPALVIAATYCMFGLLYIAVSDSIVNWLVRDPDVLTAVQTYKGWGWIVLTTLALFWLVGLGVRAARQAEHERHASDARYRAMIETTNEGVVMADAQGRCQYVNRTFAEMVGATPQQVMNKRCGECVVESQRAMVERLLNNPESTGPQRFDCELKHADGSSVWTIVSASPIVDGDAGRRSATLFMVTDITARKVAERALERNLDMQRTLLNELDHRVRNNLSSLSSLIDLSKSATGSVDEFAEIMSGRVQAMAKAHALAARAGAEGIDLGRIVAEMIPQVARSRVSIDGSHVGVASSHVVSLAMLLHEIAARSVRQGALAHASGRVIVSWSGSATGASATTVDLKWTESPAGADGLHDDHADSLIRGLVQRDLRGRIESQRSGDQMTLRLQLAIGPTADVESSSS